MPDGDDPQPAAGTAREASPTTQPDPHGSTDRLDEGCGFDVTGVWDIVAVAADSDKRWEYSMTLQETPAGAILGSGKFQPRGGRDGTSFTAQGARSGSELIFTQTIGDGALENKCCFTVDGDGSSMQGSWSQRPSGLTGHSTAIRVQRATSTAGQDEAEFRQLRGAQGSPLTLSDGNGAFSVAFKPMGFDTVGVPEARVARGRMFYEVEVDTIGARGVQVGWAGIDFGTDNDTTSETGVGDDDCSWGICGARRKKFPSANPRERSLSVGTSAEGADWGEHWKSGSVIGVAADAETGDILFALDGSWDAPMGLAFSTGGTGVAGFYPALSGMHPTRLVLNFGGRAWRYGPPDSSFVSVLQASGLAIVSESPTADTAARVYNDLRTNVDVMSYVTSLSSAELLGVSECEERQWQLSPDGERQFLLDRYKTDNDNKPIPEDNADYAVKGLTAVHVLARDCMDRAVFEAALRQSGIEALRKEGGESFWGDPRDSLPVHYAAQGNASAQILLAIVEAAGVEQLKIAATDDEMLPVHLAALSNDSLEVMETLLELGGTYPVPYLCNIYIDVYIQILH